MATNWERKAGALTLDDPHLEWDYDVSPPHDVAVDVQFATKLACFVSWLHQPYPAFFTVFTSQAQAPRAMRAQRLVVMAAVSFSHLMSAQTAIHQ